MHNSPNVGSWHHLKHLELEPFQNVACVNVHDVLVVDAAWTFLGGESLAWHNSEKQHALAWKSGIGRNTFRHPAKVATGACGHDCTMLGQMVHPNTSIQIPYHPFQTFQTKSKLNHSTSNTQMVRLRHDMLKNKMAETRVWWWLIYEQPNDRRSPYIVLHVHHREIPTIASSWSMNPEPVKQSTYNEA